MTTDNSKLGIKFREDLPSAPQDLFWLRCSDDSIPSGEVVAEIPFYPSTKHEPAVQDPGISQSGGAISRGIPFRLADEVRKRNEHQSPSMQSVTDREPVSDAWTASLAYHAKCSSNDPIPGPIDVDNSHFDSHYSGAEAASSYEGAIHGTPGQEAVLPEAMLPEAERQKRGREDDTQSTDSMSVDAEPNKRAQRSPSSNSISSSAWSTTAVPDCRGSQNDEEDLSNQHQGQGRKKRVKLRSNKFTSNVTKHQGPSYRNMQIAVPGYYRRARQEEREREAAREAEQRRRSVGRLDRGHWSAIERAEKVSKGIEEG